MSKTSNSEVDPKACPTCGEAMPDSETKGLCPVCLMASAMEPTGADESSRFEPPSIDEVQAAFPKLEIIEIIGVGGMGVVYKAKQTSLNREVALKLLAPRKEVAAGFAERFTREAQALAAMNHPHIVTVHDFGQADKFFYLLMEFVDGVNLRQAMKAGGVSPEEALVIVPPICDALQYAHDQGVVHRDIKPENLLLDREGRVKVADFGIARILNHPDTETESVQESSEVEVDLTGETALGTPNYMAPEQAEAPAAVDHRADIYSLGVVFYEMLTGERPSPAVIQPPSSRVGVDVRVDEVVLRALADSPDLRWQSATEMRTQVQTLADVPQPPPPLEPEPTVENPVEKPKRKDPWKWVALICGLISIPFVILGLIALYAVIDDGDWNPNPGEALFVWALWLGSIGFLTGTILAFVLSLRGQSRETRARRVHFVTGMLTVIFALALPVAIFISVMQKNSAQAAANFQSIVAEQALVQSLHQQAFHLRVELTSVENEIANKDTIEANERLKHLREELNEVEGKQAQAQANLSKMNMRSGSRPASGLWMAVGVVSVLLLVPGIVLIRKSGGRVALGCVVCLVILFFLAVGFVMMFWGYKKVEHPPRVEDAKTQTGALAPNKVSLQTNRPAVTQGPDNSATFSFELETAELPQDWTVWSEIRYYREGHFKHTSQRNTALGRGGVVEFQLVAISLNPAVMKNLTDQFSNRVKTSYLKPGHSVRILNLIDADRVKVEVDLELRPKGGSGGHMIYVRKSEPNPEYGNISIEWDVIQNFSDHDLILETKGASVFSDGETIDENRDSDFSRRVVNGDQKLNFKIRPIKNFPDKESAFPQSWTPLSLDPDSGGIFLFGFENPQTGLFTSAQLKLVPKGSLEDVPDSE